MPTLIISVSPSRLQTGAGRMRAARRALIAADAPPISKSYLSSGCAACPHRQIDDPQVGWL